MKRFRGVTSLFVLMLLLVACSFSKRISESTNNSNQPNSNSAEAIPSETKAESAAPQMSEGELRDGEASGSYTAKGQTVELKYAYATKGERFGSPSIIVLVTDKPIPADALAEEFKSQTMLYDEKIRGLEYVFSEDGYWVRFHPSQYQESRSNNLKDYSVENNVVRATDETDGDLTDGKYARHVKFVAAIK